MKPAALIRKLNLTPRRIWSLVTAGVIGVAIAGLAAPLIDASPYGERIRQTLEKTLGRTVQFEAVHFNLFSGPGFSLEGVTIGEDPRYGIEPFAYVPEMQVRVRPDKLLLGQIQISSLRLLEPSLNLVKRDDGTWNALELVERLSAPRRMPFNFFSVFEVSGGRIDFKFGTRKTTLYLLNSDLQIFPEHSNKLNIQFSGSPARTDRAGNEFGHLHGTINWFNRKNANDNQLQADLTLDRSNLSELTTLVEGHDAGVHGTISAHASVEGPLASLRVHGEMRLNDVHRWDLLPANGNEWQVQYGGDIDLVTDRLTLKTVAGHPNETSPVTLQMLVTNIFQNPQLSVDAHLERVPAGEVLPLGRRMGLAIPPLLGLTGDLGGDVHFTNQSGLAGTLVLQKVTASFPQIASLYADRVEALLLDDRMLFRPAQIQTAGGELQVGGEVWLDTLRANALFALREYPVVELKSMLNAWLGSPAIIDPLAAGQLTGAFTYSSKEREKPVWSGRFEFDDATLNLPGLSSPLVKAAGRVSFDGPNLEVTRFLAHAGERILQAGYRYNPAAKRAERLHVELAEAELGEMEDLFAPTVQGQGWLARLGVTTRAVPAWLADRDIEVEIAVKRFLIGDLNMGSLTSQVVWQGTNLRFSSVRLKMPVGNLQAHGTANLVSYRPKCSFTASVNGFPWRGGLLDADGEVETFGLGEDALKNLRASGTFTGTNLRLTAEDLFPTVSGGFIFTYREGWPDLRLPALQASDREGDWTGTGAAQTDGRLVLDLEHAGQQRRVMSGLTADGPDSPALVANH